MLPVYPSTDLDRPDTVLSLSGSLWESIYAGNELVEQIVAAAATRTKQNLLNLQELENAVSRHNVNVFHRELLTPVTLLQSQVNTGTSDVLVFDANTATFDNNPDRFDVPLTTSLYSWQMPSGMVYVPVLVNRITQPSVTMVYGIDYKIDNGYLVFNSNLFNNPLLGQQPLIQNNIVIDNQLILWAVNALFDRQTLYEQFGYVLGLSLPSTPYYKQLINALLDAIAAGTTGNAIRFAWAAVTGVPVVLTDGEVVDRIITEPARTLVATNNNIYVVNSAASVIVTPGQTLNGGDPLCDTLEFFEFNQGQTPDPADVPALSLGTGMISAGYFNDLTFQNTPVPLVVETDDDGYTKVSWALGGWPGDVQKFFDDTHTAGVAVGQTLAMLMDQRPPGSRDTQPQAGSLPRTINPLQFLCQNILRANAFIVKIKMSAVTTGTGLDSAKSLRKIVPPGTAMLVLIELDAFVDSITMDQPGTDNTAGYTEKISVYLGETLSDTINPAEMIVETLRCYQIGGYCV